MADPLTLEGLLDLVQEIPYSPSTEALLIDITHPDLVLIGRRALIVGTASTENPAHFDTANRIAILHISDLQDVAPSAPKNTEANGQP